MTPLEYSLSLICQIIFLMCYTRTYTLTEKLGNNAFAWEERMRKYGVMPTLTIPSLIDGDISDVQIDQTIAFEEIENGVLRSCQ